MHSHEPFPPGAAPAESQPEGAAYESADAHPRTVLLIAGVIAGGVVLSLLTAGLFYHLQFRELAGEIRQTSFRNAPFQRTSIAADWTALDRENDFRINTYGWIDRPKGIVRVPIARAMDLLVAEASQQPNSESKIKGTP